MFLFPGFFSLKSSALEKLKLSLVGVILSIVYSLSDSVSYMSNKQQHIAYLRAHFAPDFSCSWHLPAFTRFCSSGTLISLPCFRATTGPQEDLCNSSLKYVCPLFLPPGQIMHVPLGLLFYGGQLRYPFQLVKTHTKADSRVTVTFFRPQSCRYMKIAFPQILPRGQLD